MTHHRSNNSTFLSTIRSFLSPKSSMATLTAAERDSMMNTYAEHDDSSEEYNRHNYKLRMPTLPSPNINKALPPLPEESIKRSQTQIRGQPPRTRMRTLSHRDRIQTQTGARPRTISRRGLDQVQSVYHVQNLRLGKDFYVNIFRFLDKPDLVAVAGTCKTLREAAYQVLYETVTLAPRKLPSSSEVINQSRRQLPASFHNLLSTMQTNDNARAQVRHLSIYWGIEVPQSAYDWLKQLGTPLVSLDVRIASGADDEHLMNTILRCPALRLLHSFTHTGDPILFRNVERLSFLLSSTPRLKRLAVTLPNQLGQLETISPSFPASSVEHATITSPKFDATLRQLLLSFSGSVKVLELSIEHPISSETEARNTLYALGISLRQLALHLAVPATDYTFLDYVPKHLTGLRGLYLSRGTCTKELLNNLHHASGLQCLGFAGCMPDIITTDDLVRYLGGERKHPRLRLLFLCPAGKKDGTPDPSVALHEACRKAGVRMKRCLCIPDVFDVEKVMGGMPRRSKPIFGTL
ncbi:hypothetical protein E1B28_007367 [Marasmius oreades]|uniref:F-box domain-containing protein n=1 Tax=Marasmius oreades TaxID=181124 RepID=A0A9P7S222_9AGAR|nr:uncharacterized protein E1B28_007367 [Marasmius oreades]KAG7093713.1 hypothetical protein E1B28_007367 [Marasmius oreades]